MKPMSTYETTMTSYIFWTSLSKIPISSVKKMVTLT